MVLALLSALLCICWASAATATAAPTLTWSVQREIDQHQPSAISCPSSALCVVVDRSGDELTSVDPTDPLPAWSAPAQIDEGKALVSVSCASPSACAAVDEAGKAFVSTNPAAGANAWHPISVDHGAALNAIACASSSLCVAVDGSGNAIAIDPSNADVTPIEANIDGTRHLRGIACPGASLCVAADEAGGVLMSNDPGAVAPNWQRRPVDPGLGLIAISCAQSGLCVAVDDEGDALASNDPDAPTPTWSSTQIDTTAVPTGVSCAISGLCVVVDDQDKAFASDDATGAPPTWVGLAADAFGVAIEGVACLPEGRCLAIDSAGRTLSGLVPPPVLTIGEASTVTQSTATLTGAVDPNDAVLGECIFEYGTSTGYGQSVPCGTPPLSGSASEAVSAQLAGLEAGTIYHYRLRASNGAGVALSEDHTLNTVEALKVSIVDPHPSISGVPAVGLYLHCNSGVPSGSPATFSYSWTRDATHISGATSASYQVQSQDAKHHLQCTVTTKDAAGSAKASSAFVAIPAEGVVASAGETAVGQAKAEGTHVNVPLTCSAQSAGSCEVSMRLTVIETLRGSKVVALAARRSSSKKQSKRQVTLTVGTSTVKLAPAQQMTVAIALTAAGRALLSREHRLPLALSVTGTVIGSIKAALSNQRLTLLGRSHVASARRR